MKRALILLGSAGLLVAAGCGEDSTTQTNEYVDQVNAAQQRFARSIPRLDAASRSPRAIGASIGRLRAAVATTSGELRAIEPPAKARAAHAGLVGLLGAYAGSLRRGAKAIPSRFPGKAARAARAVLAATTNAQAKFDAAITEINARLRG